MLYIGIDLHARQFTMSVLDRHNSTIFEETLPTSCESLDPAAVSASAPSRGRLRRPRPPRAVAY